MTDRSIRTLVKIFDIDEYILQDDLAELLRRLDGRVATDVNGQVLCSGSQSYGIDTNLFSVSGTWCDPVPSCPKPKKDVHAEIFGEAQDSADVVGGRCQVPSSVNFPLPLGAPCYELQKNPYHVASLVQSVMDLSHVGNDSSVSGAMSQSFGLSLVEMESLKFMFDEEESSLSSSSALLEEEEDAMKLLFPSSSRS